MHLVWCLFRGLVCRKGRSPKGWGQYVLSHWFFRKSIPPLPVFLITNFLSRMKKRLSWIWFILSLSRGGWAAVKAEQEKAGGGLRKLDLKQCWNLLNLRHTVRGYCCPLACVPLFCLTPLAAGPETRAYFWFAWGIQFSWFVQVFPIKLYGSGVISLLAGLQFVLWSTPGATWAAYLPVSGKGSCRTCVFTIR